MITAQPSADIASTRFTGPPSAASGSGWGGSTAAR
jgi:hypothetical protein